MWQLPCLPGVFSTTNQEQHLASSLSLLHSNHSKSTQAGVSEAPAPAPSMAMISADEVAAFLNAQTQLHSTWKTVDQILVMETTCQQSEVRSQLFWLLNELVMARVCPHHLTPGLIAQLWQNNLQAPDLLSVHGGEVAQWLGGGGGDACSSSSTSNNARDDRKQMTTTPLIMVSLQVRWTPKVTQCIASHMRSLPLTLMYPDVFLQPSVSSFRSSASPFPSAVVERVVANEVPHLHHVSHQQPEIPIGRRKLNSNRRF